MNTSNSKLLIKTFDGSLMDIKIKPKCKDSTVTFNVKYYDHEGDGSLIFGKWSRFILRLTCLIIVLVQNFVAFMRYLMLIRKKK